MKSFFGTKELRAQQAIKDCVHIKRNTNVDTIPKEIWEIGGFAVLIHPDDLNKALERVEKQLERLRELAKKNSQTGLGKWF
jgi:predicted nucleotide-binding protein